MIGRLFYDTDSLPDGKMDEIRAASEEEGRDLEFGYIMDHLREERSRGITIDTAQCFFSTDSRDYVIIDAPGHTEFLKNMITGASQAEAAVLICSVAEGVQEQTRRHAYLLKLLGLDQVLVAYNKMDMVDYDAAAYEQVKQRMAEFLARIGIEPSFSVPTSAKCGDNVACRSSNMPWYDGPTFLEALDGFEKIAPPLDKPLRFPVQDVYTFDGRTVIVGRVETGVLRPGDDLVFQPGGWAATVKEVLKYRRELSEAGAGECVGVVLNCDGIERGLVGAPKSETVPLSESFQASIFWLAAEPFRTGQNLVVKCSTQDRECRIANMMSRINSSTLEHLEDQGVEELRTMEIGEVTIRTSSPMVVQEFQDIPELGRFVLQRDGDVVAGGIVTAT